MSIFHGSPGQSHVFGTTLPVAEAQSVWHDNNTVNIYRGRLGWNWTRHNSDGKTSGDVGYGSKTEALSAARE